MLKTGGERGLFFFLILISTSKIFKKTWTASMKQEQAARNKENREQEKAPGN